MKILNLYAGIGGNRKLWGNEHDITAVEYDVEIAAVYQDLFPNDETIWWALGFYREACKLIGLKASHCCTMHIVQNAENC